MLDVGSDDPDDLPTVHKRLLLQLSFVCHFIFYVIVSQMGIYFCLGKNVYSLATPSLL